MSKIQKFTTLQEDIINGLTAKLIERKPPLHGQIMYLDMGMGKTYTTVAFMQNYKKQHVYVFSPELSVSWTKNLANVQSDNLLGDLPAETRPAKDNPDRSISVRVPADRKAEADDVLNGLAVSPAVVTVDDNENLWFLFDHAQLRAFAASVVNHATKGRESDTKQAIEEEFTRRKDNSVYVFDEAHQLREFLYNTDLQHKHTLTKIMTQCKMSLLLTGTVMYHGTEDLLYSINLASGAPSPGKDWLLPFDVDSYEKAYYRTNLVRAGLQGWLIALLTLQVAATPVLTKIMDVGDFYANNIQRYKKAKNKIVWAVLRRVPLLEKDILVEHPEEALGKSKVSFRRILTIFLYYMLSSPFSGLIPGILTLFMIQNRGDIRKLNKKKFFKVIEDYIEYGMIEYTRSSKRFQAIEKAKNIALKASQSIKLAPREQRQLYEPRSRETEPLPNMEVTQVQIGYSQAQTKTFIRFTVNRLTPTETNMLGMLTTGTYDEYLETKRSLTMEDLETTGLKIGNLSFKPNLQAAIQAEYNKGSQKNTEGLRAVFEEALLAAKTVSTDEKKAEQVAVEAGKEALETINAMPSGSISPKFRYMIKQMVMRFGSVYQTVVYSRFLEEGLRLFYDFIKNEVNPKLSKPVSICWYLTPTTVASLPAGHPAKTFFDNTEGSTTEEKQKNILEGYAEKKFQVLLLDAAYTEGVDGIRNTQQLHILEPITSFARLRQLRARVVRKGSHCEDAETECLQKTTVKVFEYRMTLKPLQDIFFNREAISEWFKNQRAVIYTMRTKVFNQSSTPDEVVFKKQRKNAKFEDDLNEFLANKKPPKTPSCQAWAPPNLAGTCQT